MANISADQYNSVFSSPAEIPDFASIANHTNKLETLEFSEEDIIVAINQIDINSATGPDGIPAILLNKCKKSLSKPLNIFWKKCIEVNFIPQSLKYSIKTPIYKEKSKGEASNYRPISITLHLIKIFAKIIKKIVVIYMIMNYLITSKT